MCPKQKIYFLSLPASSPSRCWPCSYNIHSISAVYFIFVDHAQKHVQKQSFAYWSAFCAAHNGFKSHDVLWNVLFLSLLSDRLRHVVFSSVCFYEKMQRSGQPGVFQSAGSSTTPLYCSVKRTTCSTLVLGRFSLLSTSLISVPWSYKEM